MATRPASDTQTWRELSNRLWQPQVEAMELIETYINDPELHQHAALIRMPTGTGKTGIMALSANLLPHVRNTLIVVPSVYLKSQVAAHVTNSFWEAISHRPQTIRPAQLFLPSTLAKDIEAISPEDGTVLICTPHTLYDLHKNAQKEPDGLDTQEREIQSAFCELVSAVDLVFVDEGHREPARHWARAVRDLGKPTVLLSATPYRNDLRLFNVGRDKLKYRRQFTYHDTLSQGLIRRIELRDLPDETCGNPQAFAAAVCDFYLNELPSLIPPDQTAPKVILRCGSYERANLVLEAVRAYIRSGSGAFPHKAEQTAILVHHRVKGNSPDEGRYHDVPPSRPESRASGSTDAEVSNALFWIHESKLAEGLDDPGFCVIAFYDAFGAARSLVQQVGRLIRNPRTDPDELAFVLHSPKTSVAADWKGYLEFEANERNTADPQEIVQQLIDATPEWTYFDGAYRSQPDFDDPEIASDLRLRRSAQVYGVPPDFDQNELSSLMYETSELMADKNMTCVGHYPPEVFRDLTGSNSHLHIMLHWNVAHSPHLSEGAFFDISLVASVAYLSGTLLLYQAPTSTAPTDISGIMPVAPPRLERLLGGSESRVKELSLNNCDLGPTSIRRRNLGGFSISESAPALNDHFHFVSSAIATPERPVKWRRRYIGFLRGRVTERSGDLISPSEFIEWASDIVNEVRDTRTDIPSVMNRYAQYVPPPKTAEAAHILIDLTEFKDEFRLYDASWPNEDAELYLSRGSNVAEDGSFECTIAGRDIQGTVRYENKRFAIQSDSLDENFCMIDEAPGPTRVPSSYISNRAVLRIITKNRLLYTEGRFYEPRRPFWKADRVEELGILTPVPGLNDLRDDNAEKGDPKASAEDWCSDTLFGFISPANPDSKQRFSTDLFQAGDLTPAYLICDDYGKEPADFIAIQDSPQKVALIHAKCGAGPGSLSASQFQEVYAQAIKNLEILNPYASAIPGRASRWGGYWSNKRIRLLRAFPRLRGNYANTAKHVEERFLSLLRDPATTKEVWVVMGNAFSVPELIEALRPASTPPEYHIVQLGYLLQALNASVSAMGATLRVFAASDAAQNP